MFPSLFVEVLVSSTFPFTLPPHHPPLPDAHTPLLSRSHNSAVTWQRAPSWTQHQPRYHGNWRHDTDVVNMSGLLKRERERKKEWEGKKGDGGGVGNVKPRMHSVLQRPMRRRRARQAALRGRTPCTCDRLRIFTARKTKASSLKTLRTSSTVVFFVSSSST